MSQPNVTIIDYGMCNLLNVARAFEYCGAKVKVTEDPRDCSDADRLVVPGVGAFKDSLHEVNTRGFGDAIREFSQGEKPIFGICVGMQMLFDVSEEFGEHPGLGVIAGRVRPIPNKTVDGQLQRVPHIGWNHLVSPETKRDWTGTLLDCVKLSQPAVYFVHSFSAVPERDSDRLADCIYGGHRICAAVQRDNIIASQFHPERSGEIGLSMIRQFLIL